MKKFIYFLLLVIVSLSLFSVVHAAGTSANEVVSLDNPLGEGNVDLRIVLGNMVNKVLGVLGAVALLVFVIGGAMWLTSGGNAEKVKNGSMAMMWAIIGLFIIFSSYAILNLVLTGLFVSDKTVAPAPVQTQEECLAVADKEYADLKEVCATEFSNSPDELADCELVAENGKVDDQEACMKLPSGKK